MVGEFKLISSSTIRHYLYLVPAEPVQLPADLRDPRGQHHQHDHHGGTMRFLSGKYLTNLLTN